MGCLKFDLETKGDVADLVLVCQTIKTVSQGFLHTALAVL